MYKKIAVKGQFDHPSPQNVLASGLYKKALLLSYFTLGYNILEGLTSIFAGVSASSIALIGFGLDSFVESLSGGVMVWRFSKHGKISQEEEERIEAKAIKLIAYTFSFSEHMFYMNLPRNYIFTRFQIQAFWE